MTRKIVVVGWGPAAHRFVTGLLSDGTEGGGDGGPDDSPGGDPAGGGGSGRAGSKDIDLAVTVYAAEGADAHDREALPDALSAGSAPAAAALPAIQDPRLDLRVGVRVTAIDRMHRVVHATDHRIEHYDALVLATGANPVLPPIRNIRAADGETLLSGVFPAHSAADFRALAEAAQSASRAVVIGGSTTGLRVATALHTVRAHDMSRPPLHVELVDQMPATPEITAADAYYALRRAGVVAYQDCRVRSLEAGPDGALTAVTLADGFRLTTDLAVLTCGTAPNVALAWTAGLAVARGVVVDDALRSVSDPVVYALGGCAEHRRTLSGDSAVAREQADVLADRLSGRDPLRTYRGMPLTPRPAPQLSDVVAEAERFLKAAAA
ncbi:MAG: FAD-dependent oxidoreductase [Catenulispora sp.]|nr:FAD-dependent oxidoreductase [Catenulispora sp.]